MTDYTKTTNFAAKDSLPSGNSGKIVKGSEIDTEFNNIATAVATKSNSAAPTLTGTVTLTGILSVPDGSASAPSFTNTGDTNVGLFFSGTDVMAFTAGGTSQVTFADGVIAPVTDNDVDLGTSSLEFKDLFLDGTAHIDTLDVDADATIAGVLDVTDTTDSSDATGDTGALRVEGGASIAKKLFVGTDLDVDGTTNLDVVDIDGALTQDGGAVFNEASADVDFRVESNGNANMLFVDGGNDCVLIGTGTSRSDAGSSTASALQIEGTNGQRARFSFTRDQDATGGPNIAFCKSRATSLGSVTVVQSGDDLGNLTFCGADGTDIATQAAQIKGEVDGTPGSNDMPGRLAFHTTPDGSTTLNERMRINEQGDILINTTTDYGGKVNIARADNNTTLALICTDADSGDGPVLDFIRDSGSPGTSEAVINFKANDNADPANRKTYANIEVISTGVTAGSEAARMDINTLVSGSEIQRLKFSDTEAVFNEGGQNLDFRVESSGNTHALFVNAGTNEVGIQTNSPDGTLHVYTASAGSVTASTGANELVLENSTTAGLSILTPNDASAQVMFGDPEDNNVGMIAYDHSNDNMKFTTGGAEIGRFTTAALLVGTTTPVTRISDTAQFVAHQAGDEICAKFICHQTTVTSADNPIIEVSFHDDTALGTGSRFMIFTDENSTVGTIQSASTSSLEFGTGSDERLKENIVDAPSQLDKILDLNVRQFDWKKTGESEVGFVAQEVHKVLPNCAGEGGDDPSIHPWSIFKAAFAPYLVSAIQEQQKQIEELKSEVAKLKGDN